MKETFEIILIWILVAICLILGFAFYIITYPFMWVIYKITGDKDYITYHIFDEEI